MLAAWRLPLDFHIVRTQNLHQSEPAKLGVQASRPFLSRTISRGGKTMATAPAPLDMDKLNAFSGQFVGDLGAAVHAGMVVIGEKLGLYKALATGAMTSAELAAKTKTDERYVREWLSSQAAGGYVTYDGATNKFSLSAEQAFSLANEDSPAYLPGAF